MIPVLMFMFFGSGNIFLKIIHFFQESKLADILNKFVLYRMLNTTAAMGGLPCQNQTEQFRDQLGHNFRLWRETTS